MKMTETSTNLTTSNSQDVDNVDLQACRCCLATEIKLHDIPTKDCVSDIFGDFIKNAFTRESILQRICNICLHQIRKFNAFQMQCHNASLILQKMQSQNQKITTEQIKDIDRSNFKPYLLQTETQLLSYIPKNDDSSPIDVKPRLKKRYETRNCSKVSHNNIEEVLINDNDDDFNITDDKDLIKKEILKKDLENYDDTIKTKASDVNFDDTDIFSDNDDYVKISNTKETHNVSIDNIVSDLKEELKPKKQSKKISRKRIKETNKRIKKENEDSSEITQKISGKKRKFDKKINVRKDNEEDSLFVKNEEEIENKDLKDENMKNALLFYNSHPTKKPSNEELNKRLDILDKFSKAYNVEIKYLSKEEQKQELQDRKKHYKNLPYTCNLCYRGYSIEAAYITHMVVHDPASGDFPCDVCGIRCKSRRDRAKHVNATHLKRFKCRQCGLVTKSQSYAKSHFARHGGTNYTCDQCGKRFNHQTNYLGHIRTVHNERALCCAICALAFTGQQGLNVHMGIVHKQARRCESCGVLFHNGEYLKKHLENFQDGVCDSSGRPCPMCGENFASEKVMRKHYEDAHKKELKCEQCNKVFVSTLRLSTHMHEHRKTVEVNSTGGFICEVCGKGNFKNLNTLRTHQRLHTGERPYKCTECPKAFRLQQLLKSHMCMHTDERPYKCPLCPKAFHQSAHRAAHLLSHTKERPYPCGACPKRYSSASAAREHRDTQHRGLPARRRKVNPH